MPRKNGLFLRVISIFLIGSFCVQELSWAAPSKAIGIASLSQFETLLQDPSRFEVSSSFASLKEFHKGTANTLIIHIQDPHSNPSGQENLASTLDQIIKQYGITQVFVEGGDLKGNLDPLKKIASPEVTKQVAKSLLLEGKIHGEEYLNLTTEDPIQIQGVEDMSLYQESVKNYAKLAKQREETINYLKQIQNALEKLKNKLYPKEILDYEKIEDKNYIESFERLIVIASSPNDAPRNDMLNGFPNLQKLKLLQNKEKQIDFNQANLEYAALLEEIHKKGGGQDLESSLKDLKSSKDSRLSLFSLFQKTFNIARSKDITLDQYPALVLYENYLKEFSRIDMDLLLNEKENLEEEVYKSVIASGAKQSRSQSEIASSLAAPRNDTLLIYSIDRYIRLLFKAHQIQMTSKDFKTFQANEPDFSTVSYQAFINKKLTELGYFEDLIPYKNILEEGKKALTDFYESVDQRDLAFMKNLSDSKAIVLITGGYHTEHLKQLMKAKGYSYIVLTPNVKQETNQKRYEKLLLSTLTVRYSQAASRLADVAAAFTASAGISMNDLNVRQAISEIEGQSSDEASGARMAVHTGNIPTENRALIFSQNADALDAKIFTEAKKAGRPYLRLVLKEPADLDRLKTAISLNRETGVISTSEGKLIQIIRSGGILLIDYNSSDPKLVEGFNSLFDSYPYFGNVQASPNLQVIGVMSDQNFEHYPVSFYSRFKKTVSLEESYSNPIDSIRAPPDSAFQNGQFTGETAELFESPLFREALLGRYYLDEKGQIGLEEGMLVRAVQSKKPLLVKGAQWNDPAFQYFIRQILLRGGFDFNGKFFEIPSDFKIYRVESNFEKDITQKKIVLAGEAKLGEDLWVINIETQDILFSQTHVSSDGKLTQQSGLLERPTLRIRITDDLPDWVWHRIMHAQGQIEIEILPQARVPAIYKSLRSAKAINPDSKTVKKNWVDVKNEKVILVEGEDLGFIRSRIENDFNGQNAVVYPVTLETSAEKLIASIEIETTSEAGRKFSSKSKGVIDALRKSQTVILEGADAAPDLLRELESVLSEEPYLMENGERVDLKVLPGKLVITRRSQALGAITGHNFVEMPATPEEIAQAIKREFPQKFKPEDFDKIQKLKKIFSSIPPPAKPGLYPERLNFNLSRLRLLYQFDNWSEAFENVFISSYAEDAEVAAFMRTMVRIVFQVKDVSERSIHASKLKKILNQTVGDIPWDNHFWELADALSLDLLLQNKIGDSFAEPRDKTAVFDWVRQALVKKFKGTPREAFYRDWLKISGDVSGAPDIDEEARAGEETWAEQVTRAIRVLEATGAVMFKGSPGTGKSFVTDEIARLMGYHNGEVKGPVTVGPDLGEADLVSRRVYQDGNTKNMDEAIASWAKLPNGGLLIVDEANLTKPQFWNFLKGLFAEKPYVWINGVKHDLTKRHRVIFTGNQEFLSGRQFQELVGENMVSMNFKPFDDKFLKDKIGGYLASHWKKHTQLTELVLSLHRAFEQMGPERGFSLRDVQELCERVNIFLDEKTEWQTKDVIEIAWNQYQGLFSPEERKALEFFMMQKFGVSIQDIEKETLQKTKVRESKKYRQANITLVDSAAKMEASIDDFMKMHTERSTKGRVLQGKRGMIFEGPSGRGKDVLLAQVLKNRGYKFYHLNAALDYDQMLATIRKAQAEGSIVIISEMNLLPSAFLEGKLNDILTGRAHKGFALFATINSVDFSGREKLSTALQNRVIYERIDDYAQNELLEIAKSQSDGLSEKDLKLLVNLHAWIRENVGRADRRPTTRELSKTLLLMGEGKSRVEAVQEIYGPVFLDRVLKGKTVPADAELLKFEEKLPENNIRSLELLAGMIIPRALGPVTVNSDASDPNQSGGYYSPGKNSITLRTKGFESGEWRDTFFHEASHGRNTRDFKGLTPSGFDGLNELYQDLEDVRHEAAFKRQFPFSSLGVPSDQELRFGRIAASLDVDDLLKWASQKQDRLSPRNMFQRALTSFAKGVVTKEQITVLADVMDGLFSVNPLKIALAHLDAAKEYGNSIPVSLDEEEIQFQQYRALKLLQTMREDYLKIPEKEEAPEPEVKVEDQKKEVEAAIGNFQKKSLTPEKPAQSIETKAPPVRVPTKEEIEAKKKALEERKRKAREATRKEIEVALKVITDDLKNPFKVEDERLDEMLEELTNEALPFSVLPRIKQLEKKDSEKIQNQIKVLIARVKQEIKDRKEAPEISEGQGLPGAEGGVLKWVRQRLPSYLGGAGGSVGGTSGRGGRSIKARHPSVMAHKKDTRHNPIDVTPEKIKKIERSFLQSKPVVRDPLAERVTSSVQKEFERTLDDFFNRRLEPEKIYGAEGTLDVQRFATGDPTTAFMKSGGKEEKTPKELVISHPVDTLDWNPILDELFQYLFTRGFKVTVYTSLQSYVDGISNLSDLKQATMPSGLIVGDLKGAIESDLSTRKKKEDYALVDLKDLQKKCEADFLYGAFRLARQDSKAEKDEKKSEEKPIIEKPDLEPYLKELKDKDRHRLVDVLTKAIKANIITQKSDIDPYLALFASQFDGNYYFTKILLAAIEAKVITQKSDLDSCLKILEEKYNMGDAALILIKAYETQIIKEKPDLTPHIESEISNFHTDYAAQILTRAIDAKIISKKSEIDYFINMIKLKNQVSNNFSDESSICKVLMKAYLFNIIHQKPDLDSYLDLQMNSTDRIGLVESAIDCKFITQKADLDRLLEKLKQKGDDDEVWRILLAAIENGIITQKNDFNLYFKQLIDRNGIARVLTIAIEAKFITQKSELESYLKKLEGAGEWADISEILIKAYEAKLVTQRSDIDPYLQRLEAEGSRSDFKIYQIADLKISYYQAQMSSRSGVEEKPKDKPRTAGQVPPDANQKHVLLENGDILEIATGKKLPWEGPMVTSFRAIGNGFYILGIGHINYAVKISGAQFDDAHVLNQPMVGEEIAISKDRRFAWNRKKSNREVISMNGILDLKTGEWIKMQSSKKLGPAYDLGTLAANHSTKFYNIELSDDGRFMSCLVKSVDGSGQKISTVKILMQDGQEWFIARDIPLPEKFSDRSTFFVFQKGGMIYVEDDTLDTKLLIDPKTGSIVGNQEGYKRVRTDSTGTYTALVDGNGKMSVFFHKSGKLIEDCNGKPITFVRTSWHRQEAGNIVPHFSIGIDFQRRASAELDPSGLKIMAADDTENFLYAEKLDDTGLSIHDFAGRIDGGHYIKHPDFPLFIDDSDSGNLVAIDPETGERIPFKGEIIRYSRGNVGYKHDNAFSVWEALPRKPIQQFENGIFDATNRHAVARVNGNYRWWDIPADRVGGWKPLSISARYSATDYDGKYFVFHDPKTGDTIYLDPEKPDQPIEVLAKKAKETPQPKTEKFDAASTKAELDSYLEKLAGEGKWGEYGPIVIKAIQAKIIPKGSGKGSFPYWGILKDTNPYFAAMAMIEAYKTKTKSIFDVTAAVGQMLSRLQKEEKWDEYFWLLTKAIEEKIITGAGDLSPYLLTLTDNEKWFEHAMVTLKAREFGLITGKFDISKSFQGMAAMTPDKMALFNIERYRIGESTGKPNTALSLNRLEDAQMWQEYGQVLEKAIEAKIITRESELRPFLEKLEGRFGWSVYYVPLLRAIENKVITTKGELDPYLQKLAEAKQWSTYSSILVEAIKSKIITDDLRFYRRLLAEAGYLHGLALVILQARQANTYVTKSEYPTSAVFEELADKNDWFAYADLLCAMIEAKLLVGKDQLDPFILKLAQNDQWQYCAEILIKFYEMQSTPVPLGVTGTIENLDALKEAPKEVELSFEEQVKKARDYLLSLGVEEADPTGRLRVSEDEITGKKTLELNLSHLEIRDLGPVGQLTSLTVLCSENVSGIQRLEALSKLENLRVLILNHTDVKDLSPVSNLKKLELLGIQGTKVQDLSPLRNLKYLRTLLAQYTDIHDLSPLNGMKYLDHLDPNNFFSQNLDVLSRLPSLKVINTQAKMELTEIYLIFTRFSNPEDLKINGVGYEDIPSEKKPHPTKPTFEDQFKLAADVCKLLDLQGPVREYATTTSIDNNNIALNFSSANKKIPSEGLSFLSNMRYVTKVDLGWLPYSDEELLRIFEGHPNPFNLRIESNRVSWRYATIRDRVEEGAVKKKAEGLETSKVEPKTKEFLSTLINSLVDRQGTLTAVKKRFQEDGQGNEYVSLLEALKVDDVSIGEVVSGSRMAEKNLSFKSQFGAPSEKELSDEDKITLADERFVALLSAARSLSSGARFSIPFTSGVVLAAESEPDTIDLVNKDGTRLAHVVLSPEQKKQGVADLGVLKEKLKQPVVKEAQDKTDVEAQNAATQVQALNRFVTGLFEEKGFAQVTTKQKVIYQVKRSDEEKPFIGAAQSQVLALLKEKKGAVHFVEIDAEGNIAESSKEILESLKGIEYDQIFIAEPTEILLKKAKSLNAGFLSIPAFVTDGGKEANLIPYQAVYLAALMVQDSKVMNDAVSRVLDTLIRRESALKLTPANFQDIRQVTKPETKRYQELLILAIPINIGARLAAMELLTRTTGSAA